MHHPSAPRRALLLLVLLLGIAVLPAFPAQAEVTTGITGTVTGPDGLSRFAFIAVEPVDPSVELDDGDGFEYLGCELLCDTWTTESDGRFTISLPAGEYWVQISSMPRVGEILAPEWWRDSASRQDSTKIVVSEGALTTIDPELGVESRISGTIAQAAGTAGAGFVEAWVADDTFPGGYQRVGADLTDADGKYTIPGLTPGDYLVHARVRNAGVEGWYGGTTGPATSTPVTVAATGSDVSGTDLSALSPFSRIRGTITSPATGPVAGAHLRFAVRVIGGGWQVEYETTTGADGTYAVPAEAGTYRVEVTAKDHLTAGLGGGPFVPAPSFTHVQSQDRTGTDVTLTPSRAIAVTPARISGIPRVGSTLTALVGSWYPSGLTYSYQWLSNGWPVPGATKKTYVVRPADARRTITLKVSAAKADVPAGISTAWTQQIRPLRFTLLGTAAANGTLSVGSLMTAKLPTTSPVPTRVRYQWMRDWRPISGATARGYRLRPADRGQWIGVRITLIRSGYVTLVREPVRQLSVR